MHIRLLTRTGEPLTHADVCLTLERRSEPRPRGGRVGGAHEHREGMRRDRGELRAAISPPHQQPHRDHCHSDQLGLAQVFLDGMVEEKARQPGRNRAHNHIPEQAPVLMHLFRACARWIVHAQAAEDQFNPSPQEVQAHG